MVRGLGGLLLIWADKIHIELQTDLDPNGRVTLRMNNNEMPDFRLSRVFRISPAQYCLFILL